MNILQINSSARREASHSTRLANRLVQRLRPGVTGNDALAAYTELMQPRVAALGVQVAPRFGTWNVVQLGPAANDLSTIPGAVAPVLQPPAS